MAVEIKPGFWYVGCWFFDFPDWGNGAGNWNLWAWCSGEQEPKGTVEWEIKYRFRYFRSAKIWESGDVFRWFNTKGNADLATIKDDMTDLATALCEKMNGGRYEFFPLGGNIEHCMNLLRTNPPKWMHGRTETINP